MRRHVATTDYALIGNPVYRHDTRMEVKKILPGEGTIRRFWLTRATLQCGVS